METKLNRVTDELEYPSMIIGKLMQISGILQRESNRLLFSYRLNQHQFSVLFEITRAKEVRQKDMVNRLMLERAHVSKVVKKLQIMGLVDIIPLPGDKRSSLLTTTTKGKALVNECQALFRSWNNEWFEPFHEKELDQILNSMDRLQKVFLEKFSEISEY